jgi:hypothetical protein
MNLLFNSTLILTNVLRPKKKKSRIFCLFVFVGLASHFAKQALYCLSHTFSAICSGYFGDGGLTNYFSGLASNFNPAM